MKQASAYHLIGDGIAGTLLAHKLSNLKLLAAQYGDGNTNTPPVAFLHLFQGRTFHRHPIEVQAFEAAVAYWRAETHCQEWTVERTVNNSERLQKSVDTDTVPKNYRPVSMGDGRYQYRPGFTIDSESIMARTRSGLTSTFQQNRVDINQLPKPQILATGLDIEHLGIPVPWDTNPGRTLEAQCLDPTFEKPNFLYLYKGLHLGGKPLSRNCTLGGRVNSKGEARNDEGALAYEILQKSVEIKSEWWGKRIANAVDRWPLIGFLDSGRFLFAGFGGRAFFWLPWCLELAIQALQNGNNENIPKELRADRFRK